MKQQEKEHHWNTIFQTKDTAKVSWHQQVPATSGYLIVATFSSEGPNECSGLPVMQYNQDMLTKLFSTHFKKLKCFTENHETPSGSLQNFLYCVFQKIS